MILSIIIPMYKVEPYIDKCLLSCLEQDIPIDQYEIICINDGSPDNSEKIALNYAQEYSNIKVLNRPNGGLSAARNTGMSNAIGDYYMFVDSDDWIEHNCLSKIIATILAEKPDCLALCGANVIDGVPHRRRIHTGETPVSGPAYVQEGFQDGAPFAIWSSKFFKKHNFSFKQGIYHEDSELTPRAYYLAEKVSRTNDIIYYVYQNPNSITRSVNYKRSLDLIGEVCTSLHIFYNEHVKKNDQIVFDRKIATLYNNANYISKHAPSEIINQVNTLVYSHKEIIIHLKKSKRIRNIIQYYLLLCFPHKSIQVYNFLSSFRFK